MHCIGQNFSLDTSLDATRAFLKNSNFSNVLAGRPQLIEIEESHRGFAAQDTSHNKSQPQGLQQQDPQNPYDQQQRAEQLNASPCMSKSPFFMPFILMRLEQGRSISEGALPRPWNPFVANRLHTAVSPDFHSLKYQAYLDST